MTTTTTPTRLQPTLTSDGAWAILAAARAHSLEIGVPVNISVTDAAGHELAFLRVEGAPLLSMGIARDKAWTVCAFKGVPTERWYDLIKDEPALLQGLPHRDRFVIFGGGVPVLVDGQFVGAVGCSGGSAEEDADVARAGAAVVA